MEQHRERRDHPKNRPESQTQGLLVFFDRTMYGERYQEILKDPGESFDLLQDPGTGILTGILRSPRALPRTRRRGREDLV